MSVDEARHAAARLSGALERDDFAGYDPYDALSSPFLRRVARTRRLRGAAIQGLKRSPVNLRPLLGVPRRRHTKALALLVSAYAQLGEPDRVRELAAELVERQTSEGGWAYDFDVQTRWGFYPTGQPNAVVTAFAANALLDAGLGGEPVERAVAWAQSELHRPEGWFAYYPGARYPIHNASLLVAALVARTGGSADDAVAFALEHQRPDGSWPYGEGPRLDWVDGYHTVYVLESLDHAGADDAIARGLDLFLTRLVDPDGGPRATLESRYPLDTHAAATAITGLCRLAGRDERALPTAERILAWTLDRMQRDDGHMAFQQHRRSRSSIPYVRWSDAHMLLALATYLETRD